MPDAIPLQQLGQSVRHPEQAVLGSNRQHYNDDHQSTSENRTGSLDLADVRLSSSFDRPRRPQSSQAPLTDAESPTEGQFVSSLPPADGGIQAWSFLVAATIVEMLVWGLPYSVGVLHEYWMSTLFQGQGESTVTLAATLQTGLLYMNTAAFGPVFSAYPRWMRPIQSTCFLAAGLSLVGSAFATKPWHLIVSIGLFYPFAGAAYMPCATLLFEWFNVRRGMASGILFAGTGAGGAIYPLLVSGLLKGVGYKATMISLGLVMIIVGHGCLLFIKRRIPLQSGQMEQRRLRNFDWSFSRRSPFWGGCLTILLTTMGSFIPTLWLPTFAKKMGLTHPGGTGLVSIMNGVSVAGLLTAGYLSDKLHFTIVMTMLCVGSALSCFFLWGFGVTNVVITLFAVFFGLLAPSITSLWSRMIVITVQDDPITVPIVFCLFSFTKGVGNFVTGPISDALLRTKPMSGAAGAYGHDNYGALLLFAGTSILAGAFTIFPYHGK